MNPLNQTFHCNHCGLRCDTIFGVFLHIFTSHMGVDIGLPPYESKIILSHGWWDDGFWQVIKVAMESDAWTGRN